MKVWIALAVLCGCGVEPTQQCRQTAAVTCNKLFECWTSAEDRGRLRQGSSAEECAGLACEPLCATWDAVAASQCATEFSALTCGQLRSGVTAPSCAKTCG